MDVERLQVLLFRPGIAEAEVITDNVTWAPNAGVLALEIDVGKLLGN